MIEIKKVKTENKTQYTFVEELMHTAFPQEERRDTAQQRDYSDHHPLFHNNIIQSDKTPIGMISYWNMGSFFYIEHFAISPTLRNRGYGRCALETIKQKLQKPLVLEVERPTDETSIHRIHFYQRQAFTLHEIPYVQPPYRPEDNGIPMYLMTYGDIDINRQFEEVRNTLYSVVYGCSL